MAYVFRHAICNECFERVSIEDTCRIIKKAGYSAIEIAPFTLAEDPATVPASRRREVRDVIHSEGLGLTGLHWLMVSPKGLHVTTPDAALRAKSWLHVKNLIDLCGDLSSESDSRLMVFGSPFQRGTTGGLSREEATRHFVEGFASLADHAKSRGVTLLMEALAASQCDVVQSLDEAASLVREINHPNVKTMFDTHNAVEEAEPHTVLLEKHYDVIRHVHVNEMDGRHCGTGDYDFKPVLEVLKRRNYPGWVSLEAFDFTPGGETIANESIRYLEGEIAKLI